MSGGFKELRYGLVSGGFIGLMNGLVSGRFKRAPVWSGVWKV